MQGIDDLTKGIGLEYAYIDIRDEYKEGYLIIVIVIFYKIIKSIKINYFIKILHLLIFNQSLFINTNIYFIAEIKLLLLFNVKI